MSEGATVGEWVRWASRRLQASSPSARLDAELLLAFATGVPRSSILGFPERRPGHRVGARVRELTRQRRAGVPLAYLTGEKSFYSITVGVGPEVLVPRAETELLVEEAVSRLAGRAATVLDLGTGSGAIALAIKSECPDARVTAVDRSLAALTRAETNARRLALDVSFAASDWWSALGDCRFNLVLCNPPYVRSRDPHFEGPLRFEPRAALDGGDDGLESIRSVLAGAARRLAAGGALLLEHGYDQRPAVAALAPQAGLVVSAELDDMGGRPRLVVLRAAS